LLKQLPRKHAKNRRNAVSVPPIPGLALVSDTGTSTSDRNTRSGSIRVLGLVSGATWQYSLNGGSTWLTGSSTSFVVPQGSYAAGQVQVRQRSSAGLFSAANTSFAAFTVDTFAAAPAMVLAADTGTSSTDRISSDGTIKLAGLEPGATWQYSLNGGSIWLNGSGSSFVVPRGSYAAGRVRVRQRDLAGNLSVANASFAAFTVDNLVAAPRLALAGDTGSSSSDRVTRNSSLLVSGLESGATWQFSLDGGQTWQKGTASSFVVANGSYQAGQVRVRQFDRAGNTSAEDTSFAAFTVDTAADLPQLALLDDTGSSASDRITNNAAVVVTGLEVGASWQYSINGGASWISDSGSGFILPPGSYGAGQVRVRQIDRAGNTSAVDTSFAAFTIDKAVTVPGLALAADSGASASDRITANPTLLVSGLEEGANWQISIDGGISWTSGSGNPFSLADGSYGAGQVQVRQTDRAGNTSSALTTFAAFTVDTGASAPGLALAADTGSSAADRFTANRTIEVLGLEEGASWQYSLNGASSWITGSGSSFVLADGNYGAAQVQVRQTDRAGNSSPAQTAFAAFTIDSSTATPGLALAADTGSSTTDRITANRAIQVLGLEEGASWHYSLDGGGSWTPGSGSSFDLADGRYESGQVQVRQTDRAGNSSGIHSIESPFTIDTRVALPALSLAADTGSSAADRITSNSTILVSGLEDGASWQYSLNGGSSWLTGSGTSFVLADGSYGPAQVQVRQTDRAGNASTANTTFAAFTLDTVAAAPGLVLTADTGLSATDRITANSTLQVLGLEENASWEFSLDGGNSWSRGSGSSFEMADGRYEAGQVQVRQADRAGNPSPALTSLAALTVDTLAAAPGLALAVDSGSSSTDRLTNNGTLNLSGLEEGSSWEYSLNGGSSWQAGSGSNLVLADGSYAAGQVRVRQTDAAGNTSPALTSLAALTVDSAASPTPVAALAADSGSSSTDRFTNDGTITLSGLEEGSSWEYSLNGGNSWQAGSGSTLVLADGSYAAGQVQVRQTDAAGNSSAAYTGLAAFTVDSEAAVPTMALVDDTGSSATDRLTSNGTIAVSGLEAGATWQYSTDRGQNWRTGTGLSFRVEPGSYATGQVQVRQFDPSGNWSAANQAFAAFTVTLPSLAIAALAADQAEGNSGTTAFTFQVTRSGDTNLASTVDWSVIGTGAHAANALDFAGDALPSGTVTFAAGETTKTITVQVVADALFGPDETFAVTLANPSNAAIAMATAAAVIRNDDLSIQQPVFVRETTLPDGALGAISGKGWTGTGLVHDPLENVFWVANHGQATKTSPFTPSIVKMSPDGSSVLAQIDVKSVFPDNTTIQGLTLDSSNQSLWFAAIRQGKIRNISKTGEVLGEFSFDRPNGLAYDPLTDRLIVLHQTGTEPGGSSDHTISEIDKSTGAILRSYNTGPVYGADMLYLDPTTRYLYLTYGADPSPGDVRVFDHDAGKHIGTIGSLSKVTATEGIAVIGENLFLISDDFFDPDPRQPDITNRLVSFRHLPVASSEGRDVVTGTASADVFSWNSLADTTLVSYDTIVNYSSNDLISIDGSNYDRTLSSSLGNIASLTYGNMISFLNNTRLPASAATAFTVTGMNGTFVALNDQRSAFQAETDGLLFLKQYALGSGNTVSIG
jgi:hypothetical protein